MDKTRDKTFVYSPIMINKIIPSTDDCYLLKIVDTSSLEPTNQNSIKVTKVFFPKKTWL